MQSKPFDMILTRLAYLTLATSTALSALLTPGVRAQAAAYPSKPINLIVSFAAGGNADLRARQLAPLVGAALGKTLIVENKPGASGNIGHDYVAHAAPDGYTLGLGGLGPLAVNASLFPKMNFDPARDFVPIVLIEQAPLVLVTRSDKPYKSLKDIVAAAKAKPGSLTIANAGTGGAHHLSGELLQVAASVDLLPVPYKGGGPAAGALLAGEVDLLFEQTYAALPSIQAGKTRALAVTSDLRLPSLPDVPTMAELGYADVTVYNWLGLIAPKGTPPQIVKRLNEAFNNALNQRELREKITGPGNLVGGGSPDQFAALMASERKRWSTLIKAKGITME
jgi:tripartite-type tricarboxylate transporter receptor subunit TctC